MKKRGSALLVVVIIMFFVFLMAAIMVQMTIRSKVNSKADFNDSNAYYCAEAGINNTINYLSTLTKEAINDYPVGAANSSGLEQTNVFDSSSSYKGAFYVISKGTGTPPGNITLKIDSIGTYEQTKYSIETQVQLDWNTTKSRYQFSKFISKKSYKATQP
jgi:hypothetical protein